MATDPDGRDPCCHIARSLHRKTLRSCCPCRKRPVGLFFKIKSFLFPPQRLLHCYTHCSSGIADSVFVSATRHEFRLGRHAAADSASWGNAPHKWHISSPTSSIFGIKWQNGCAREIISIVYFSRWLARADNDHWIRSKKFSRFLPELKELKEPRSELPDDPPADDAANAPLTLQWQQIVALDQLELVTSKFFEWT